MKRRKLPPPRDVSGDDADTPSATRSSGDVFRAPSSASTASDTKPTTARKNAKKTDVVLDAAFVNKMNYAVTRKQRHFVLRSLVEAVVGQEVDEKTATTYMALVEQRVYDGYIAHPMHVAFNLYRGELYRQRCFSILWAARKHGAYLMRRYSPTLLASLPAHLLVDGTESGEDYRLWKEREERTRAVEKEMREARANEKGEGWLRCHRCGGSYETSLLQLRGADEPMTLFMTCKNCGQTKKKG